MTEIRNRALIYVRKSQVRNRRDEISPERQLSNCQAAIEQHGWITGEKDVYQDAEGHRSGRSEEHRPAWRALKTRIASDPTIAAVVVNSLDRGSRSPKDFFTFLDILKQHEIELVSVTEQFDTSTAIGRAFLAILMVIASLESDLASERMTDTVNYLRAAGQHWGRTPYGYTRNEDAIPQPDDTAPAVVAALEYYARGGHGYADMARYMNNHSAGWLWREPSGLRRPWRGGSCRSLISNVLIYAGWVPQCNGNDATVVDKASSLEELIALTDAAPGQHEPLIDADLVERVLEARHNHPRQVKHGEHVYLLTPMLYCALCGKIMRGQFEGGVRRYIHRTGGRECVAAAGGTPRVTHSRHPADDVERNVFDLLDVDLTPDILADLRRAQVRQVNTQPDAGDIQAHVDRLRDQAERLRDLYLIGDYTMEEYTIERAKLQARIQSLEAELGERPYHAAAVAPRLKTLLDLIHNGNPEQQERALKLLFKRIEIDLQGQVRRVEWQSWVKPLMDGLYDLICS